MSPMNQELLDQAAEWTRAADRIAVLTGAGVSAESGVPTFRASDGLWEGHRIEEVATPFGFAENPELVWNFYKLRRANLRKVRPNPGHHALAKLESEWDGRFTLITQNVDGLHRAAGNANLLELHGNIRRTRCPNCGDLRDQGLTELPALPECQLCGSMIRPDIVWFGEMLDPEVWTSAEEAADQCDLFFVVGTSAVVYPAAGLISLAKSNSQRAKVIEVNMTETEASRQADIGLYGPSGEVLPALCERLGLTLNLVNPD